MKFFAGTLVRAVKFGGREKRGAVFVRAKGEGNGAGISQTPKKRQGR